MEFYWWFFIPAIFLVAFSSKITSAAKEDQSLKKVVLTVCAGAVLITLIGAMARLFG